MVTFREGTLEDLRSVVDLYNRANPWDPPSSLEVALHREQTRDPSLPRAWVMAEEDGTLAGYATARPVPWLPRHLIQLRMAVDPARQRRGIGSALLARILPFARAEGRELQAWVSEQNPAGIAFAAHHGFIERYRMFESALDVAAFDDSRYAGLSDRLSALGIVLTTLAAEDSPQMRRAVYDLWKRTTDDVPFPDPLQTEPFEDWVRRNLEGPSANMEAFVLAKSGDRCVGLAYMGTPPGSPAYNFFTAVDREYRGRGLGLALKLETIRYAREHHISEVRTNNNTTNAPMLAVNDRLGYRRLPGRIIFGRPL